MVIALTVLSCQSPDRRAGGGPRPSVTAPDSFDIALETSRGPVEIRVRRSWAPRGADRLYDLVSQHYYDDTRFYRVIPGFMAQFGASGDPALARSWADAAIPDDPVTHSNERGTVSFASGGPDTRTTQLFINTVDNARLDAMGFAPVGEVQSGMAAVDSLFAGYGEGPPYGRGPDQAQIAAAGNAYLDRSFPQLDRIRSARIAREWPNGG